jgi:hypothetical protein
MPDIGPGIIRHETEDNNQRSFIFKGNILGQQEGPVILNSLFTGHPVDNRAGILFTLG